ncbi:MAG: glycosyltransferase [Gemmatimonadota bacterium]|nr:glycosyltransferase [Gemmatimonadota bacterium]MDH5284154.1 glycosyltransferase [Gemmatimonadota bacterium]
MTAPFSGLRILLVAPVDDAFEAHNGLRRRALERLGASVQLVDPIHAALLDKLVGRSVTQRVATALGQYRPDLVIVSGEGAIPGDQFDALRSDRSGQWVWVLGDDLGDVAGVARAAMAFDEIFVGSTGAARALDGHGVKHVRYLPVGCDPSVHRPLRARGPFRANVVFAGMATPRRERYLQELVEFGLALWGPGWRKTSLRDYCRGELPGTEDFVRAYAGATVAVNVHRSGPEMKSADASGVNRRTFELAAIGTAQVVDARADLPQHFEDGSELLVYVTPDELRGQVKRALQEDKYRERLSENARRRALGGHTYMHRMAEILRVAGRRRS